jgi:hypothetical protein
MAINALSTATEGRLETFDLGECIFTVRHVLVASIGSRLRGEASVPHVSGDRTRLVAETEAAVAQWKHSLRRDGYSATSLIDDFRPTGDLAPG